MIPKPHIARWKDVAPWNTNDQVEQDLVISRTLVEIFSDDFLRDQLAFRGGTALHKLYLKPASRCSEDIDLVQVNEGPIKPILKRIGEIISFFEEDRVVKSKANNNTIFYRYSSEYSPEVRQRIKIEINCREHFNVLGWKLNDFDVKNEWFDGKAQIRTYQIDELLGTKLRALYQRNKGRDLFDLFYAGKLAEIDKEKLIVCYKRYMKFVVDKPPTSKQFLLNLETKLKKHDFIGDLEGLLRPEIEFDENIAFDWVKNEIIEKL